MRRYPILEVCARIEGHALQHQMLREFCRKFTDWQGLVEQAESEGMAPLLRKHLLESEADVPISVRRSLNILHKRHQKQAVVRLQVLKQLLSLFQQHLLTPILLKGSALCQTLYPSPALRPMRDMDILFSKDEVDQAQHLLSCSGFRLSKTPWSPDHYHLPLCHMTVDDVNVCFELHLGLYKNTPPYYPGVDFQRLLDTGKTVNVGATKAVVFNHEETLHYLYQHAFRAPLTYEKFKLINAADIIGYTEKYFQEIDWPLVKKNFPGLHRALPLLHHISPWDFDRISEGFISQWDRKKQLHPIPFTGWPQLRVKELKGKVSLKQVLRKTFLPPPWWLRLYYSAGYSPWRFPKALLFDHPKNVFWWVGLYSHFVMETDPASINPKNSFVGSMRLFIIAMFNRIQGVVIKILEI